MNPKLTVGFAALAFSAVAFARAPEFVPGEVIIKVRPNSQLSLLGANASIGATIRSETPQISTVRLRLPSSMSVAQGVRFYRGLSWVEYAEPNFIRRAFVVPNDAFFNSRQWAPQRMQMPAAWDLHQGSSNVVVSIVDTGVQSSHPDLVAQMRSGYDFVDNDTDPSDSNGHGTHCAGIAAASTNNGVGIAGIAWNATIMPIKVLSDFGWGSVDDINRGITYSADNGAHIISLSLGGPGFSNSERDAVRYAFNRGSLLVAAAGNDNSSERMYPAGFDEFVLAVGSTDPQDRKSGFSNYGADWVDVAAPGGTGVGANPSQEIYSTIPGSSYDAYFGTSMACPQVAGLAALVWSALGANATNVRVRQIIENNTDPVGSWVAKGRVNGRRAVEEAARDLRPPVTVAPATVDILMGAWFTGTSADLAVADNRHYVYRSAAQPNVGQVAHAELGFRFPHNLAQITGVTLRFEGNAPTTATGMLYLWDLTTNKWVLARSLAMRGPGNDVSTTLPLGQTASRYVTADGRMRMLVRGLSPNRRGRSAPAMYPLAIDQAAVTYRLR